MIRPFNRSKARAQSNVRSGIVSALTGAMAALCLVGAANAAQKASTSAETPRLPFTSDMAAARQDAPAREVEVVIVWGFRLRTTEHDLRRASVMGGYSELVGKSACIMSTCGFVVVKDGNKWRTTNVMAASEVELQELERNMERDGTVLVIVHPTGEKRDLPEF